MGSPQAKTLPLKEFEKLLHRLRPAELARIPVESLPDYIPLEIVESAPIEVSATLEELIFKQQSLLLKQRSALKAHLGKHASEIYDLAMQPQTSNASQALVAQLKNLQAKLNLNNLSSLASCTRLKLESDHLIEWVDQIKAHYRRLLTARSVLRTAQRNPVPDSLAKTLLIIDQKLKRRIRFQRTLLDQFYAQRLMLVAWIIHYANEQLTESLEQEKKLGTRLTALRLDLEEIERKWIQKPGRQMLTARMSELRTSFDRTAQEILARQLLFKDDTLKEWLDCLIDFNLLRSEKPNLKRLAVKSERAFSKLLSHYFLAQELRAQKLFEIRHQRNRRQQTPQHTASRAQFLSDHFEKRLYAKDSPYYLPDVVRKNQLKKLEIALQE